MTRFVSEKIMVTGLSVVSSLGCDVDTVTAALWAQRRGLSSDHRFRAFTQGVLGLLPAGPAPSHGGVAGLQALTDCLAGLARDTGVFDRFAPARIGLYLGTSNSGVDSVLEGGQQRPADALEAGLRQAFPLRGPSFTFCTACSSAAHAIAQGAFALAAGEVDAVIAGGVDLLTALAVCGFASLQILDAAPCRPFHQSRAGINLGEGGALLLLERAATAPKGRAFGSVAGCGSSSDAHHITNPDPSGAGMRVSMERALQHAGVRASDVGYINAHGTGTRANDAAEALAVSALFGASTPASSTKGLHGHVLGSAGALEAAVSLLALREGAIWAGAPLEEAAYEAGVCVPGTPRAGTVRYALSNSFGFGGNNVSLVFASESEVARGA